jgi:hypothetical protein
MSYFGSKGIVASGGAASRGWELLFGEARITSEEVTDYFLGGQWCTDTARNLARLYPQSHYVAQMNTYRKVKGSRVDNSWFVR